MRAAVVATVAILSIAPCCYRVDTYACREDSNCVDGARRGTCEQTGWCGYPDTDCPSGRRYDDLAGDGLAHECVAPSDGDTTLTATTVDPSSTSSASESTTSTPTPNCEDEDGDGFGNGETCLGADCDDDNPEAATNCLYVGPDGDDDSAGTRDEPWRTFARAVTALGPGMSLVVLPGTYTPADHGGLIASCTGGAANGTAESPIFVRADVERQAHIATGGTDLGIRLEGCAHWRVRGLQLSSTDAAGGEPHIVEIESSSNVQLRRLLLHGNNRYRSASALVELEGATDLTIEECEAYDFTGSAFHFRGGDSNVIRRVYVNGRDASDLPNCTDDVEPFCSPYDGADYGLISSNSITIENSIFENTTIGVNGGGVNDARVLGVATIGGTHGVVFGYYEGTQNPEVTNVVVEHLVSVTPSSRAVYLRTVADAYVRNVTAVGGGALRADLQSGVVPCPEAGCLIDAANLLVVDFPTDGLTIVDVPGIVVHHSNSEDYRPNPDVDPIDDDSGYWRQCISVPDDRVGLAADRCIAYIPSDSPNSGAGENGADIGASLLFRYHDGVLQDEPLWDPQTGAFPCGDPVLGVNDEPTTSCLGVHVRLHVATPGCPLP